MRNINTITGFKARFKDEESCREFLVKLRFQYGKFCPYCDNRKIYTFKNTKTYKCAACLKKFSILVGTLFENSKIPLQTWFLAIFLLSADKKGITSTELADKLGVSRKTAWFMYERVREKYELHKKTPEAGTAMLKKKTKEKE